MEAQPYFGASQRPDRKRNPAVIMCIGNAPDLAHKRVVSSAPSASVNVGEAIASLAPLLDCDVATLEVDALRAYVGALELELALALSALARQKANNSSSKATDLSIKNPPHLADDRSSKLDSAFDTPPHLALDILSNIDIYPRPLPDTDKPQLPLTSTSTETPSRPVLAAVKSLQAALMNTPALTDAPEGPILVAMNALKNAFVEEQLANTIAELRLQQQLSMTEAQQKEREDQLTHDSGIIAESLVRSACEVEREKYTRQLATQRLEWETKQSELRRELSKQKKERQVEREYLDISREEAGQLRKEVKDLKKELKHESHMRQHYEAESGVAKNLVNQLTAQIKELRAQIQELNSSKAVLTTSLRTTVSSLRAREIVKPKETKWHDAEDMD